MNLPPFGTLAGELLRAGIVAILMLSILAFAEEWRRRRSPPVEVTRKFVHLSMGFVAMALPWLVSSAITLAILVAPALGLFVIARRKGWLRSVLGVERSSLGDLLFPVAVLTLFAIGRDERVFYLISMFTLVACDTLAAMIGKSYGRLAYAVEEDRKSLEGSAVFLLMAFLGVHLPLLLATDIGRAESVIISLQLALLVASFEALSPGGWDNLFVPLGTFYLLHKLTPKPVSGIAVQLTVQVGLLAISLLVARMSRVLTFSGALAAHLVLYASYSLGEPGWVAATLLTFVAFVALEHLTSRATGLPRGGYQVETIFLLAATSVVLIFADNTRSIILGGAEHLVAAHPFRAPFVGALTASAAAAAYMQFAALTPLRASRWKRAVAGALYALIVVTPVGLLFAGELRAEPIAIVIGMTIVSIGLVRLVRLLVPRWPRNTQWDLRLVALAVLVASIGALPVHFWWLNGPGRAAP